MIKYVGLTLIGRIPAGAPARDNRLPQRGSEECRNNSLLGLHLGRAADVGRLDRAGTSTALPTCFQIVFIMLYLILPACNFKGCLTIIFV